MTEEPPGWTALARQLARTLAERGALHDPAWREALESVPRHVLVPRFHVQRPGSWRTVTAGDPDHLSEVWSNRPLITSRTGDGGIDSSSSQPGLMVRMLELLRIEPGQRVLEIGTGTGYNAALLAHRLGDRNVFSVDINPALVDQAREALLGLGHRPRLAARDGASGWSEHAPYDRIVATCSVRSVPACWAAQLRDGGLLLADVRNGPRTGNLALLRRDGDRLQGRFVPGSAAFMPLRHTGADPDRTRRSDVHPAAGRLSAVGPEPPPVVRFIAQFSQPPAADFGYLLDPGTLRPRAARFTAADGSACTVGMVPVDGRYRVTESGPVPLWRRVEDAHDWWQDQGEPGWDRLGLTVRAGGQRVWLDRPDGPHRWTLRGD
jgi:protein-L-isoaspartate(D-aspartate) O-methyltransferase